MLGDDGEEDVGGALVDAQRSNVAVEALHDVVLLDAAAAEQLHRAIDDALRGLSRGDRRPEYGGGRDRRNRRLCMVLPRSLDATDFLFA